MQDTTAMFQTITDQLSTICGGVGRSGTADETDRLLQVLKQQVGGPETQFPAVRPTSTGVPQAMGCRPLNGTNVFICTDTANPSMPAAPLPAKP
jgi:hypothetical protein